MTFIHFIAVNIEQVLCPVENGNRIVISVLKRGKIYICCRGIFTCRLVNLNCLGIITDYISSSNLHVTNFRNNLL